MRSPWTNNNDPSSAGLRDHFSLFYVFLLDTINVTLVSEDESYLQQFCPYICINRFNNWEGADIRGPSTSDSLMNKETDHLDIRTATINLVFVCLHLGRGPLSDFGPNPQVENNFEIFS